MAEGSTRVKVFPQDTTDHLVETSSHKPLFQATFQPIQYAPSIPFSLSWAKYIGVDVSLVQPPLPKGEDAEGELPGTDRWCKIIPVQSTNRATLGWVDLSQRNGEVIAPSTEEPDNFWPGIGRWQVGLKLEDADIVFGEGIYWDPPKTNL